MIVIYTFSKRRNHFQIQFDFMFCVKLNNIKNIKYNGIKLNHYFCYYHVHVLHTAWTYHMYLVHVHINTCIHVVHKFSLIMSICEMKILVIPDSQLCMLITLKYTEIICWWQTGFHVGKRAIILNSLYNVLYS